jgi:hypothetical protein
VLLNLFLGFSQKSNSSISIYSLPKNSEYKFRVSLDRIKSISETKKVVIENNRKLFEYFLNSSSFTGKAVNDVTAIDIRLLIELKSDGISKILSISSTNLIQIDNEVYQLRNQRQFFHKVNRCLSLEHRW